MCMLTLRPKKPYSSYNDALCKTPNFLVRSRMSSFEEYINSLKEEAERGSNPNSTIALDKFIRVADNIVNRVLDYDPVPSMIFVNAFRVKFRLEKGIV